ncbi:hypothetical protein E1B28_012261 [Marasmius oreades]|uniref:Uncharacterized protein n=1 Tax=Marasmius oreades TaxID=181124 RepID=A0A9P7UN18_9AGAR|nr:uncharacterized protein E1B28_012261 [Marasmius oreades]KAG7088247.1 hypothetical protein E1B28_012261 [Marasmius oreades]
MVRKLPLDNIQDSPTSETFLHPGDSQNSDAILVALDNLKAYAAKVAGEGGKQKAIQLELVLEEADEPDLGLQGSPATTPIPPISPYAPTLTEQSRTKGILSSMDERSRVAVLVDNAVETFGPIPRDVFEAILRPADANMGLMSAVQDFSVQQVMDVITKIVTNSPLGLSEEIHRVLLFTGHPHIMEYVRWTLGFKSDVIRGRVVPQLLSNEREELVDLYERYEWNSMVAPLLDAIIGPAISDLPADCQEPIDMDRNSSSEPSSSTQSSFSTNSSCSMQFSSSDSNISSPPSCNQDREPVGCDILASYPYYITLDHP